MPLDACCEDIEIDKSLSFLNNYVKKSLEEGAQPYVTEHERCGTLSISNLKNHEHCDATAHSLRFEAYEVAKPVVPRMPPRGASSSQLAPEQSYPEEVHRSPSVGSLSGTGLTELRLRLDGVQKKWGLPSHSSGATSTSDSDYYRIAVNGIAKANSIDSSRRQPEVEVSEEKQKLAASLFGVSSSRSEKKPTSSSGAGHDKGSKASRHTVNQTAQVVQPPPDLLDLGEPTQPSGGASESSSTIDPFKQLEGLLGSDQYGNIATTVSKGPIVTSNYSDAYTSGQNSHETVNTSNQAVPTKGPNFEDALGKDALVRQVGVTPTSQNPNLFKDLLG